VTDEIRGRVRGLLETHSTATLATHGPDGPWAAAVFFASDSALRLYFLSDQRTRHGRDLNASPEVAVAINADCRDWSEIRGLQIAGRVAVLDGVARDEALNLYLAKFPAVAQMLDVPRGADEAMIAKRLGAASLYCLTPSRIRLIDNSRGFGFKEELCFS
jgi:uncharacterized protein YhbP (UPF0306 family)